MDTKRRQRLKTVYAEVRDSMSELSDILSEEREMYSHINKRGQRAPFGIASSTAISNLDDAEECLSDALKLMLETIRLKGNK